MNGFKYTPEHIVFLKIFVPRFEWKETAKLFNRRFNTNISTKNIRQACQRRGINRPPEFKYFQKGNVPWNKGIKGYMGANSTSFKKGNKPSNYQDVGTERFIARDTMIEVKIAEPNQWKARSRVVLERNGQIIPDNFVVFHKNGIGTDDRLENLIIIPRSVLVRIGHCSKVYGLPYKKLPPELQEAVLLKAQLHEKIKEIKNGCN